MCLAAGRKWWLLFKVGLAWKFGGPLRIRRYGCQTVYDCYSCLLSTCRMDVCLAAGRRRWLLFKVGLARKFGVPLRIGRYGCQIVYDCAYSCAHTCSHSCTNSFSHCCTHPCTNSCTHSCTHFCLLSTRRMEMCLATCCKYRLLFKVGLCWKFSSSLRIRRHRCPIVYDSYPHSYTHSYTNSCTHSYTDSSSHSRHTSRRSHPLRIRFRYYRSSPYLIFRR